jgi:hypothetical protein
MGYRGNRWTKPGWKKPQKTGIITERAKHKPATRRDKDEPNKTDWWIGEKKTVRFGQLLSKPHNKMNANPYWWYKYKVTKNVTESLWQLVHYNL